MARKSTEGPEGAGAGKENPKEKELKSKLESAIWTSMTKDSVWNGVLPGLLGCFYYQLEGNKSISMARVTQLRDVTLAATMAKSSRCQEHDRLNK